MLSAGPSRRQHLFLYGEGKILNVWCVEDNEFLNFEDTKLCHFKDTQDDLKFAFFLSRKLSRAGAELTDIASPLEDERTVRRAARSRQLRSIHQEVTSTFFTSRSRSACARRSAP